jgi:wobble nucleotide-excising tRNase
LSEGEKTFITFLYYLEICKGTLDKHSTIDINNRIIIIDDPISSLDSNILFAVSVLIKNILFKKIDSPKRLVPKLSNQIIILTHNIYFFQDMKWVKPLKYQELKFFRVYKNSDNKSIVENTNEKNIMNDYETSWVIVKNYQSYPHTIIPNTIRKILEYYFNFTSGYDDVYRVIGELENEEEGYSERQLLKFINKESHDKFDDFVFQYDSSSIQKYFNILKKIFIKTGHEKHYYRMMDD